MKSIAGQKFDLKFWNSKLKELGYPIADLQVSVQFLRDRRAIPSGINLKAGHLLYSDPQTFDIVLLEFDRIPTRTSASRISRYWKNHQGGRQMMIFTDHTDSSAVVIPGTVESSASKARILSLSEMLFRTDEEALQSLKHIDDKKLLRDAYDTQFLPYDKVRDDFFNGYRNLYQNIFKITKDPLGENASAYSQRFLGRLMFLYFLQRKGWLRNNKRFVDTVKNYMELNWIFYNALSKEGNKDFPYLDGTLFEREDYLTEKVESRIYDDMDNLFRSAREFFNQYNFTVDELSSTDVEVSVDPAMIGTIFENMLPEHDRGAKGTFYTPPEEISFICRRALAAYLGIEEKVAKDSSGDVFHDGITMLLESLRSEKSEKKVRELRDKILKIKVMDPAVGSGGFLLGMMHEMLSLLRDADQTVGLVQDAVDYKKNILRNLFGFDIEGEAIEIAKLRLWLSFIIDRKEPETLPSLDMNLLKIEDSLLIQNQIKIDDDSKTFWDFMSSLKGKFISETDSTSRARLRRELQGLQEEMKKKTGLYGGTIEYWGIGPVDIIVMNPPYVRQELIPDDKKNSYVKLYKLDKKSDLYAYFLIRASRLIKSDGIVSVISSDKWLETGYGLSVQKNLSTRLISIFGQRERTFGADINSVIFTYGGVTDSSDKTDFVYFESYSSLKVRNHVTFVRSELKAGKWFYLRAPKLFMEKIYPKLTHRLGDFAEIKFGIKTGANDFFYMKDVSGQYEADYLANPKKFEEWGVKAKNEKELKEQGLIYIENEGKEKFVINLDDTKPLVRTTKELKGYTIKDPEKLCLYTRNPGEMTRKYIAWGEMKSISIRGRKEPVIGYNNVPSVSGRKNWYSLNELEPTNIILPMYVMDRFFVPYSKNGVICDNTFYTLKSPIRDIFLYLNSTIFYMTMELYLRRLGGGGGVGEIKVDDYLQMPVPDLKKMDLSNIDVSFYRDVKRYFEEVRTEDRKKLDLSTLKSIGINDFAIEDFYKEFVELVDDRLIKADRGLKSREDENEQDN